MLRTDFVVDLMVFYRYVYLHSGSCEDECHNSKHQVEAISSGTENSVSELVVRVTDILAISVSPIPSVSPRKIT